VAAPSAVLKASIALLYWFRSNACRPSFTTFSTVSPPPPPLAAQLGRSRQVLRPVVCLLPRSTMLLGLAARRTVVGSRVEMAHRTRPPCGAMPGRARCPLRTSTPQQATQCTERRRADGDARVLYTGDVRAPETNRSLERDRLHAAQLAKESVCVWCVASLRPSPCVELNAGGRVRFIGCTTVAAGASVVSPSFS
jgi:hypothetical protein